MRVLITGGCGFLGSNLAANFLAQGWEVVVADALFRHGAALNLKWLEEQSESRAFQFIQLDLAENHSVDALFRRYAPFDYICHVGGQVAMTTSMRDPRRDLETNVIGTFNILEACRRFSPRALIAYSSTNKVYGDLEWLEYKETDTRYQVPAYPNGFNESLPLDFSTPYGCSKGAADQYVRDWARVFGLKTVVFRHSTIYGGRQFASFDQGWIGWFCQKALEQKLAQDQSIRPEPFTIAGTGKQVRDILHASDLTNLYQAAYANRDKLDGEIFNIGGGIDNSLSLLELFEFLSQLLDLPPLIFTRTPRRSSDQDCFIADVSKATLKLGWRPKTSTDEGIREILEWSKNLANN